MKRLTRALSALWRIVAELDTLIGGALEVAAVAVCVLLLVLVLV